MNPVRNIQKKSITLLAAFWGVGIGWMITKNFEQLAGYFSFGIVIAIMIVQVVLLISSLIFLLRSLTEASSVYREHTTNPRYRDWLLTNVQTEEEFEDERTFVISRFARERATVYFMSFLSLGLFLLTMSTYFIDINNVSIESIVLFALFAISVYYISYIIVWKKEYYR